MSRLASQESSSQLHSDKEGLYRWVLDLSNQAFRKYYVFHFNGYESKEQFELRINKDRWKLDPTMVRDLVDQPKAQKDKD